MIKWGVLSSYIQNGVLKDAKGTKYSDADLLIWARWAMVELSYHTAELAQQVYDCDGVGYQFDLPDDMVDDIEHTGLVGLDNGKEVKWLPSLRLDPQATWQWPIVQSTTISASTSLLSASNSGGFYEWPSNCLTLSFVPKAEERLVMRYFKIWDPPTSDESILQFPFWMEKPFAFLVGAGAMDPKGVQASDIRQWNDKTVQGLPEHNPLHKQAEFFIKHAERLLAKHRVQDRENFFNMYRPRQ